MKTKTKAARDLKIISYNLKHHKASLELGELAERYDADILCVQECYAELLAAQVSDRMVLADKTLLGRLNLAIYYRKDRFQLAKTESHQLKTSVYEQIMLYQTERLLVTSFYDRETGQELSIGSFHATQLVASNYLRRLQIQHAHAKLSQLCGGGPAIMVGDYNYPLFRKRLREFVEDTGYQISISDRPTYQGKVFRGHFDLATSLNAQIDRVLTLPRGLSDHAPILVTALI